MSEREKSIALADNLEKNYARLEKIHRELDQNFDELNRPYTPQQKMKSGDLFNWWPVIGLLVSIPMLVISGIIYMYAFAMGWDGDPGAGTARAISYIVFFLSIVVFLAIQVIGRARDDKKIAWYNASIDREIEKRYEKVHALKKKNAELYIQVGELQNKLSAYNSVVPAEYRTSSHMHQVKKALSCSKAETFEDAIALLDLPRLKS